jgi:hypothetical protein
MRPCKGTDEAPTSCSHVEDRGKAGWPTGREPQGHGAAVVVVGVTAHRGGRDSRPQGEGHQADGRRAGREARCRVPTCAIARPLESRVQRKLHARFGGGPTEKGRSATVRTSPAAYPTFLIRAVCWHSRRHMPRLQARTRRVARPGSPPVAPRRARAAPAAGCSRRRDRPAVVAETHIRPQYAAVRTGGGQGAGRARMAG